MPTKKKRQKEQRKKEKIMLMKHNKSYERYI